MANCPAILSLILVSSFSSSSLSADTMAKITSLMAHRVRSLACFCRRGAALSELLVPQCQAAGTVHAVSSSRHGQSELHAGSNLDSVSSSQQAEWVLQTGMAACARNTTLSCAGGSQRQAACCKHSLPLPQYPAGLCMSSCLSLSPNLLPFIWIPVSMLIV